MSLFKYVLEELKMSRMYEYTCEYTETAKAVQKEEKILGAKEHSKMSEMDFRNSFDDTESFIKWYFSYLSNMTKLDAVSEVGSIIRDNGIKCLISFGAGPCVLEYFIELISRGGVRIVATDYDDFMIRCARDFLQLNNFIVEKYDFYHDDVKKIVKQYEADAVVMFGSACSMDDERYLQFLKLLKMAAVRYVITFEAGIESGFKSGTRDMQTVVKSIKRYFCKQNRRKRQAIHAFKRTPQKLTKIYKRAGFQCKRLKKLSTYQYSYLLINN